jgi:valyl-tRNA synthetase
MSKSLGNGIDPLEVIEKYGADALRFTITTGNTPGNDMRFFWERVESNRNFANKLWNASRFVLMNLEGFDEKAAPDKKEFTLADKWILSRYTRTLDEVTRNMEKYELGEAARMLYEFIWNEYCDWYIEMAKPRLYNKENVASRAAAQYVLWYVLENTLKLLHPFMPFITESIWQHLPHEGQSIMVAAWPKAESALSDEWAEKGMNDMMETIKAIRNMRAEVNVPPGKKCDCILHMQSNESKELFSTNVQYIKTLAAAETVEILAAGAEKPDNAMTAVASGVEIYLPLKGLIDVEKETARLNKEVENLDKELKRLAGKLSNAGFVAKAPQEVIAKERAKEKEYQEKQTAIKERLAYLAKL